MDVLANSYRTACLMTVGILWTMILGCSQDGPSITPSALCAVPVIEPSHSILGVVGPATDSIAETNSSVRLRWDASSDTLGYRLYIGSTSKNYQQVADVGLLTTSMVSNLSGDMTYFFAVTAYNAAGESCPSNEVSVRIQ